MQYCKCNLKPHRTPTFRSWGKVEIYPLFDSFHLESPFLISPQRYLYAAALWAGAQPGQLDVLQKQNSQWSVRDIRAFGQGNMITTRRRAALKSPLAQLANKAASIALQDLTLEMKKKDRPSINFPLPHSYNTILLISHGGDEDKKRLY